MVQLFGTFLTGQTKKLLRSTQSPPAGFYSSRSDFTPVRTGGQTERKEKQQTTGARNLST